MDTDTKQLSIIVGAIVVVICVLVFGVSSCSVRMNETVAKAVVTACSGDNLSDAQKIACVDLARKLKSN